MKSIKGIPIETAIGRIVPSMEGDFIRDGSEITAGSMFMTMAGGKAKLKHKGKQVEIDFSCTPNGSAIILRAPGGRHFVTSMEKLINHAIEYGLLDPELRFEQDK
jgi:hypothetical protein